MPVLHARKTGTRRTRSILKAQPAVRTYPNERTLKDFSSSTHRLHTRGGANTVAHARTDTDRGTTQSTAASTQAAPPIHVQTRVGGGGRGWPNGTVTTEGKAIWVCLRLPHLRLMLSPKPVVLKLRSPQGEAHRTRRRRSSTPRRKMRMVLTAWRAPQPRKRSTA